MGDHVLTISLQQVNGKWSKRRTACFSNGDMLYNAENEIFWSQVRASKFEKIWPVILQKFQLKGQDQEAQADRNGDWI